MGIFFILLAMLISATFGSVFGFYLSGFYSRKFDQVLAECEEKNKQLRVKVKNFSDYIKSLAE